MRLLKLMAILFIYHCKLYGGQNNFISSAQTSNNVKQRALEAFSMDESSKMTELHNEYRENVKPTPSNMNRLVWEPRVTSEAREALANCSLGEKKLHHGVLGDLGWNQYVVPEKNVTAVFMAWYNEGKNFDNSKSSCEASEKCNNYIQIMSAQVEYLGCYWNRCLKNNSYLVGCAYSPKYKRGELLYKHGTPPCSRCEGEDGGRCYKGLCTKNYECTHLKLCVCELKCHYEGVLNTTTCRCKCDKGYPTLDCSSNASQPASVRWFSGVVWIIVTSKLYNHWNDHLISH